MKTVLYFLMKKADSNISGTIDKGTDEYTKATNDRNSMAANGVTLTNDINQPNTNKIGKIKDSRMCSQSFRS